jgi:hypothetical protein
MSDDEYEKIYNNLLAINSKISMGVADDKILEEINHTIEYLNIELEYENREKPSDKLSEHYQKVELCWLYYKVRDYYNSLNS